MAIDQEGSLFDRNGVLRHFSPEALKNLSVDPNRCFICGTHRNDRDFNDEHVISEWLLRRYRLHSAQLTYPNGRQGVYGQYKLRCCVKCNSLLGANIECKIERWLQQFTINESVTQVYSLKIYQWLCLLFIKTHLKDRDIRIFPDRRIDAPYIASMYDWVGLHHIHSVARSMQSGCHIASNVVGTILVFKMQGDLDEFDFGTLSDYSTIYIRMGEIGIVAVLNDSGAVSDLMAEFLSGISGPLSSLQFREIAARMAYGNTLLCVRPKYFSRLYKESVLRMYAVLPEKWTRCDICYTELGELMVNLCQQLIATSAPEAFKEVETLRCGKKTFVYDDKGQFNSS